MFTIEVVSIIPNAGCRDSAFLVSVLNLVLLVPLHALTVISPRPASLRLTQAPGASTSHRSSLSNLNDNIDTTVTRTVTTTLSQASTSLQ